MRSLWIILLGLLLWSCNKLADPPNIILIVVDDLGYSDLHCYGNELVETPYIDRLASGGIRFTQAYASCPVCSPTRAAILTGKNPAALNLTDWIPGHQASRGPKTTERFLVPAFNQELPHIETTIAEELKEAGYVSASIGKWHLGGKGFLPTDQGFDLNIAGHHKGSPPSYYYPYVSGKRPEGIPYLGLAGDSLYLTNRLTNEAIGFIRQHRENPFFLYLPYYNVHTPLQGRPDLVKKYEAKLAGHQTDTILRNPEFLAMTEAVDDNIGRIMGCLKEEELEENTLVIFTSDNGGLYRRDGRNIRASWNYPLRAGKGTLYEGGLRIPAIVRWPGRIQPDRVSDEVIISTDLFPTLTELTGLSFEHEIEGVSLLPHLFKGDPIDRETLCWHYPHYHIGMPGAAIRDGDFKLIEYYETGELELYNLAKDTGETADLSDTAPEKTAELLRKLEAWRVGNGARMPSINPAYE